MPSIWLTVTTPVPPIPIMCRAKASAGTLRMGSGSSTSGNGVSRRAFFMAPAAGSTVRKDGQSPSRQE